MPWSKEAALCQATLTVALFCRMLSKDLSQGQAAWVHDDAVICQKQQSVTIVRLGPRARVQQPHSATPNCWAQGGIVASGDANGVVRLWDLRKMAELQTLPLAPAGKAVNSCRFDNSGQVPPTPCTSSSHAHCFKLHAVKAEQLVLPNGCSRYGKRP